MDQYTTFRIGGKVDALYFTRQLRELQKTVSYLTKEHIAYLVVGRGSNLLVKDGGFKGVVIIMGGELAGIEEDKKDKQILMAGAGLGLAQLLNHCTRRGLGGLEFLAGIPGTVGGAVTMNAGAFGKDMGSVVQQIHVVTRDGELATRNRSELNFSYRELSVPKGTVVIRAKFRLVDENPEVVAKRVKDCLAKRKTTQPLEYPSAGSVFKNPPNNYAGRLIEEAGLKGKRVGGAMISPKHANYIVNTGGASADDVLALMELARKRVREQTGIVLEPEIRVVGI
jgi:UDP-N-acetylmuramate dehydrogenase